MDLQLYITFVHTLFSGYAGRVNFNAEVWGNINGFVQNNRQVPKAHERELVRQQKHYKGLYGYFSDRCLGLQNNNKFTQYRKIPKIRDGPLESLWGGGGGGGRRKKKNIANGKIK